MAGGGVSGGAGKIRVLYVEDNDVDFEVALRFVRRHSLGVDVVRARNGADALSLLLPEYGDGRALKPTAIVTDLNMPRMTGFELIEALAAHECLARIPVFVISTSENPTDRRRARELGVKDYFVKPVSRDNMPACIFRR